MNFMNIYISYKLYLKAMSNPFSLENDNKKFFTALSNSSLEVIYENETTHEHINRIKNMNNELEELARKRQQMLFKQSHMDYIFKRQKPSIGLNDFITGVPKNDKKFRVRALLKEKKQSLHDFLNKKKQIYLSKMNINIKKEETNKLADSIRDQQQTLKARQLYFENDVEFMHKFIDGIKKQAEQAQNAVEAELKQQQILVSKLNGLDSEIEKIENLISKDHQILSNLEKYKKFIQDLYNQKGNPSWKKFSPKPLQETILFMTQDSALPKQIDSNTNSFIIRYEPVNMIEIFNNSEQANIRQIQKLQDKEDELETAAIQQREQQAIMQKILKQNSERIQVLEKNCIKKQEQYQRLKQLKKVNNNKINILDNQNLDIDKMRNKIYYLYEQINPKRAQEVLQVKNQSEIKRQMSEIEADIQRMRQLIIQQKELYPSLIPDIEKDIKNKQKLQNIQKKQEENKRVELKKQQQQQKKRGQSQNEKLKGRKDMQKVMVEKKQKVQKKQKIENQNQDEKYFQGEN